MTVRTSLGATLAKLAAFVAVSLLVTTVVVASLLDLHLRPGHPYRAEFSDASGVQAGDTVRIAGVEVGKITAVGLSGRDALISFTVDADQPLSTTTVAEVHYADLLGQRFLALVPGPTPGSRLAPGSLIPLGRTVPALDLTGVFNGFQPLFAALSPDQVNQLTASIIQIFQGESGTISDLVSQTALITSNLAGRQLLIDQVVDNLTQLIVSVDGHDSQLGQLIDQFDSLVTNVAGERSQIGAAIDGVAGLTTTVSGLLAQAQPALDQDINGATSASATLAADQKSLDNVLQGFPGVLTTLDKVSSSGNYISVYLCNLSLTSQGQASFTLIPGTIPLVISLPSGPVGDQTKHTATCR